MLESSKLARHSWFSESRPFDFGSHGVALVISCASIARPLPATVSDHPLSKVSGTFYVTGKRVTARLRLFVEDLYLFHEMEPDDRRPSVRCRSGTGAGLPINSF